MQTVCTLLVFICSMLGEYDAGDYSPKHLNVYVLAMINTSQMWARRPRPSLLPPPPALE